MAIVRVGTRAITCLAASATFAMGCATAVLAQNTAVGDYPSKPITIVVPFDGGGPQDTALRNYTQSIQKATGTQFVILNRLGAGSTVATSSVARAAPDGYTILSVSGAFAIAPSMYPNLQYDNDKDFYPISLLEKQANFFVVHPATQFRSLRDYIAYARTHPGELNFSTGGVGGAVHFPGVMLHYMTKTKVTFVEYKSPAQRLVDLIAGRVHVTVASSFNIMGHTKAGRLRSLAATTTQRVPLWPDIPTVEEQGVKGYEYSGWMALLAPAKTPPVIVNKLNAMFVAAAREPAVVNKAESDGILIVATSPDEARKFISNETTKTQQLVKATGMQFQSN